MATSELVADPSRVDFCALLALTHAASPTMRFAGRLTLLNWPICSIQPETLKWAARLHEQGQASSRGRPCSWWDSHSRRPRRGGNGLLALRRSRKAYVEREGLGVIYGADAGLLLERDPDTVRAPEMAFVATERLEGEDEIGYLPFVPDLVVEVVSPSASFREVEERARMRLPFGARLMWVVEPDLRRVFVHRSDAPREELFEGDDLPGGDVLPGFAVRLDGCF